MNQQNYKLGNNTLIISALLAFAVILLCSCSARKVDTIKQDKKIDLTEKSKEVVSENKEKQSETNIKTEVTKTLDTKTNLVTETIKVTPIDATKPASFKNDKGVNIDLTNSVYEKQIKTDLSNVKEQLNTIQVYYKKELERAQKQAIKDKETILRLLEELKNKKSDKEQFNFLSLWWLLIPIYILWRKFKGLPLV